MKYFGIILCILFICSTNAFTLNMSIYPNVQISQTQNVISGSCNSLIDCYLLAPWFLSAHAMVINYDANDKYYLYITNYDFNLYDSKYKLNEHTIINMYISPLLDCQYIGEVLCIWHVGLIFKNNILLHNDTKYLVSYDAKICNIQNTHCFVPYGTF